MTTPSIKEALERLIADIEDYERVNNLAPLPGKKDCWQSVTNAKAALATLQPDGERREAIARLWQELLDKDDRTSPEEYPDMALITFEEFEDAVASGLVQNEAAIRADEREKCAKIADLFVNHDAEYGAKYPDEAFKFDNRWLRSKTIADAIRSARDGGAES